DAVDAHGSRHPRNHWLAAGPADGEVARTGLQVHRPRLVVGYVTGAHREGAFAEPPTCPEASDAAVAPQLGTEGHLDLHVDRLAATPDGVELPAPGCLDLESAVGVVDPGVVVGGHVGP